MKIGAFGEVMLRLTPPNYLLLEQGHTIRMEYTGTGVNILGNLAHFGLSTWMLTNVPDNRLGDAAKANLRQLGMNTDFVGKYHNHMGIYFAEVGYGARPTYVTYQNRHSSSFGVSKPENYPFEELGISYDDLTFFHELGADGIRLDLGFDGNKEAMLTYNSFGLAIELNMSNDVAYLDNILTFQANRPYLYGCHNFYPQEGTALPYDFFEACSKRFKNQGIRTAAFITAQAGDIGPWDINDGLPTLEMHRHLPVEVAAKHLFATNLIDDVIIGNAYASEEELAVLSKVNRYQTEFAIEFVADVNPVEKEIVLNAQHYRRGDITHQVIRSTEVRKVYKNEANLAHDHEAEFEIGDVVIGNDNFGKYKNELQVVLEPHSDSRKNKVGRIVEAEHLLLPFVQPWSKFKFTEK
jgi:uncharacterized protein